MMKLHFSTFRYIHFKFKSIYMCFTILVNTSKLAYIFKAWYIITTKYLKGTLGKRFYLALL